MACAQHSLPRGQMPPTTGRSRQEATPSLLPLSWARLNPARMDALASYPQVTNGPTASQVPAMKVYYLRWFLRVGLAQGPLGCWPGLWPPDGLTGTGGPTTTMACSQGHWWEASVSHHVDLSTGLSLQHGGRLRPSQGPQWESKEAAPTLFMTVSEGALGHCHHILLIGNKSLSPKQFKGRELSSIF